MVFAIVFERGDVAERVGVTFWQIEVLRGIRRKAGNAGANPVLARQIGSRQALKPCDEVCAAEVTTGGGVVYFVASRGCTVNGLIELVVASRICEDCLKQAFGQRQ